MRQSKENELSQELKAQVRKALAERFPTGWGRGKTLDEMVGESSAAALEFAASLVQEELKEPDDTGPAPVCPNPDCGRGKRGAACGRSKTAPSPF